MRRSMFVLVAVCAVAAGLALWTRGDPTVKYVHLIALALAATGALALGRTTAGRVATRPLWYGVMCAVILANTTGLLYWGPLSAATLLMPLSAYAYTSGAGRQNMTGGGLVALFAHATIVVGQVRGWWPLHPLVGPTLELTAANQLGLLALIQAMCLLAALSGLAAHRTLVRVIEANANAQRSLAVRDAQVREARAQARDAKLGQGRLHGRQLGPYRLAHVLGRGAMGEVYAATNEAGEPCALKVIGRDHLHDPAIARRFQREVEVVSKLRAENIVRLLDLSPIDAEDPYFVMELLEGSDLATLLASRPRWSPVEAVELVAQIAAGLDAAHGAGVVHRDLKPANIFAAGATWKILDFGASKLTDGSGTLTHDQLIGTPSYMAPEQALGKPVDHRADLYSLALVVYRVVTGAPAVPPDAIPGMLLETALKMPRRPGELADLDEDIDAVLAIALAKEPAGRFATAGEFSRAYDLAVRHQLDAGLRARARALLATTTWGAWTQDATRPLTRR